MLTELNNPKPPNLLKNSNEKSEVVEIEGILTSINIPNNKFGLTSDEHRKIINNYLEEEHSTKNKLISFTQKKASLARGFFVCRNREVFIFIRLNREQSSVLL